MFLLSGKGKVRRNLYFSKLFSFWNYIDSLEPEADLQTKTKNEKIKLSWIWREKNTTVFRPEIKVSLVGFVLLNYREKPEIEMDSLLNTCFACQYFNALFIIKGIEAWAGNAFFCPVLAACPSIDHKQGNNSTGETYLGRYKHFLVIKVDKTNFKIYLTLMIM